MIPAPGKKYFKGRIYRRGKVHPFVVWDGMRDYENEPPPHLFIAEGLRGRIGIKQLRKKPRSTLETIVLLAGSFDSIVLWTRDHALYRTIVDEVTAQSNVWMN
jgi:hypothetical protein